MESGAKAKSNKHVGAAIERYRNVSPASRVLEGKTTHVRSGAAGCCRTKVPGGQEKRKKTGGTPIILHDKKGQSMRNNKEV